VKIQEKFEFSMISVKNAQQAKSGVRLFVWNIRKVEIINITNNYNFPSIFAQKNSTFYHKQIFTNSRKYKRSFRFKNQSAGFLNLVSIPVDAGKTHN
jgi:hypothetical protein